MVKAGSAVPTYMLIPAGLTVFVALSAWWAQSATGSRLLPHAFCITGSPLLLWAHVISDALITLAYVLIPVSLLRFVRRRRDVDFGWMGMLFGAFIVACAATHAMSIWTLWDPVYWYSAAVKAFTAVVSLGTAWALLRLLPIALALPSAAQLRQLNQTLHDEVDARLRVEAELRMAKEELERRLRASEALVQSNRDLQQFASVAAHDLRAPLQTMTGYLGMLKVRHADGLGDKGQALVARAGAAGTQMSQLIDGLLSLARVDSENHPAGAVDLNRTAAEVVEIVAGSDARAEHAIEIGTLPSVVGQESLLRQLLQNLLVNAMKFAHPSRTPAVRVSGSEDDGMWTIRVADNGIGVPAEHREQIFRIFHRLHNQAQYPGSGIGLALCQRIVLRHGGRIWAEESPGGGSVFSFTLPKLAVVL